MTRANGEGSLYRVKATGRWAAAVTLPDGRRRVATAQSRPAAKDKLRALIAERDAGLTPAATNPTLDEYLTHWLTSIVSITNRASTLQGRTSTVRVLSPLIGHIHTRALTAQHIQAAIATLARTNAPATTRKRHADLRAALNAAVRDHLIATNPARHTILPHLPRREMTTLTPPQIRRLLDATQDPTYRRLFLLLATTGLRSGEARALTWPDLNLEAGTATIQRSLHHTPNGWERLEPKSDSARRLVVLPPTLITELRRQKADQAADHLAHAPIWSAFWPLVFTTNTGAPLHDTAAGHALKRALTAAGLPSIRIHDLRHTAATIALTAGVHPKVVQEMLGHADPLITLRTYSHTTPALHEQVAALMEAALRTGTTDSPTPRLIHTQEDQLAATRVATPIPIRPPPDQ